MNVQAFVPSIVSAVLVITGWFVIYRNAQKLSTRSETKAVVDSAFSSLKLLTDTSMDFWLSRGRDMSSSEFEVKMSYLFTQFSQSVSILEKRGLKLNQEKISELIGITTLDCESVSDKPKADLVLVSNRIAGLSLEIYMELMESFHLKYKPIG